MQGISNADLKIKNFSGLPVFVKGIQSPEDAEISIQAGADGIWVSNLGGAEGVKSVFEHFNKELSITMQLAGKKNIEAIKQTKFL